MYSQHVSVENILVHQLVLVHRTADLAIRTSTDSRLCCFVGLFFLHPIYFPRTAFVIPPGSSTSDPGPHSGPSFPLVTAAVTVRAFISFIGTITQHSFSCLVDSRRSVVF